MKKLILMVVMAVAMLVGCGNKPEPVTEAEVVGYWMDEYEQLYQIAEGGILSAFSPMKLGDEVIGQFALPVGVVMYLDGKVTLTLSESTPAECIFSEDRNTFEVEIDGVKSVLTRTSKEQAAEMGVDVE